MENPSYERARPVEVCRHSVRCFGKWTTLLALSTLVSVPVWAADSSEESEAPRERATRSVSDQPRSEASPTSGRATARLQENAASSGGSATGTVSHDGDRSSRGGYRDGSRGNDHHRDRNWDGRHHPRERYDGHRRYRHYRPGGYWGYGYGNYPWGINGYPYGYWGRCRWCWWYPLGATVYVESDVDGYRSDSGALDLDLNPERAQIYVDGRFVGVADDFDGFPAFLWLEEGTYDVVFYLPGYRTLARQYTIRPGVVIDVEDDLQPGESVRPEDLVSKSTERRDERIRRNEEREAEVEAQERAEAERGREGRSRPSSEQQRREEVGRLYLSLWPDDAAVYLDGHFLGTAGELAQLSAGLVVEPGEHQLEVVHPGYRSSRRTVTVPPGQRVEVKFDLDQN